MIKIFKNKKGIKRKIKFFFSINWLKTIYFNFKKFPFPIAKKLPVFFYGSVKFTSIDGKITIDAPIKTAMIGFGQQYEKPTRHIGIAEINLVGHLHFKGYAQFGKDCFILIAKNGYCEFGDMASIGSLGKIICYDKIIFGDYTRIGFESQVIDTNFHKMVDLKTNQNLPMTANIILGNYNFISNRVTVLKGTKTPDNCTIASNSLCLKDYTDLSENCLIGGVPAKLLKLNISRDWKGELENLNLSLKAY
ncbi:MAG: transferase [Flavobacteriaceae bacterium]|nr:transferase [Flavobacteriaceae bacterium]